MRIGPESNLIDGTRQIHAHYVGQGADDVDTLVVVSVREQRLEPLARARHQIGKPFKSDATTALGPSPVCYGALFFALLATTLIVVTTKFGIIEALP